MRTDLRPPISSFVFGAATLAKSGWPSLEIVCISILLVELGA
jgi:hypothetical protein